MPASSPLNIGLLAAWCPSVQPQSYGRTIPDLVGAQHINNADANVTHSPFGGRMSLAGASTASVANYALAPVNFPLIGDPYVSVSWWMYLNDATGWSLLTLGTPGATSCLQINGDSRVFVGGWGSDVRFIASLTTGRWYHIVVAKIPGPFGATPTAFVWVNGTALVWPTPSTSNTLNITPGPARLLREGRFSSGTNGYFDDIRVWNRALSEGEARALYRNGRGAGLRYRRRRRAGVGSQLWVNDGGTWKTATPWVKVGGVWTKAAPKVKTSGVWKG